MLPRRATASLLAFVSLFAGCARNVQVVSANNADRAVTGSSKLPLAVDPARVGSYAGEVKPGAGYFYDDVLEYRVWLHPDCGAVRLAGSDDYFVAFAQYEHAANFSQSNRGTEEPLALVRQAEWIDEPQPGHYVARQGERITEWRTDWLAGSKRGPESIKEFLAHPRAERPAPKERTCS